MKRREWFLSGKFIRFRKVEVIGNFTKRFWQKSRSKSLLRVRTNDSGPGDLRDSTCRKLFKGVLLHMGSRETIQ